MDNLGELERFSLKNLRTDKYSFFIDGKLHFLSHLSKLYPQTTFNNDNQRLFFRGI